jgi:hypothetical protein
MFTDLDNVISTCVASKVFDIPLSRVRFVSAGKDKVADNVIPVDIKAKKHGPEIPKKMQKATGLGPWAGRSHAGFYFGEYLPEEVKEEVDQQDSTGVSDSRVPMSLLLFGLKKHIAERYAPDIFENDVDDEHKKYKFDRKVMDLFCPIIWGLMKVKEDRNKARSFYDEFREDIIKAKGYKFFIAKDWERNAGIVGAQMCEDNLIDGQFYDSKKSWGFSRCKGKKEPDLNDVPYPDGVENQYSKPASKRWFRHDSGFMMSYGGPRDPRTDEDMPPEPFDVFNEFVDYLVSHMHPKRGLRGRTGSEVPRV